MTGYIFLYKGQQAVATCWRDVRGKIHDRDDENLSHPCDKLHVVVHIVAYTKITPVPGMLGRILSNQRRPLWMSKGCTKTGKDWVKSQVQSSKIRMKEVTKRLKKKEMCGRWYYVATSFICGLGVWKKGWCLSETIDAWVGKVISLLGSCLVLLCQHVHAWWLSAIDIIKREARW